jgi:hypothetical protein
MVSSKSSQFRRFPPDLRTKKPVGLTLLAGESLTWRLSVCKTSPHFIKHYSRNFAGDPQKVILSVLEKACDVLLLHPCAHASSCPIRTLALFVWSGEDGVGGLHISLPVVDRAFSTEFFLGTDHDGAGRPHQFEAGVC